MYHPWDMNIERGKCFFGGGTSTNTVQPNAAQEAQGQILKNLGPYIEELGKSQFQSLNQAQPGINQMLMTALGGGANAQAIAQGQSQILEGASKGGVRPGDPRIASSVGRLGENATKASLPEIQQIMSLYGMNPQQTLSGMGAGSPAGSQSSYDPSTGEVIAPYAGIAAMIAAAMIMM